MDVNAFNAAIKCCVTNGDYVTMNETLNRMKKSGVKAGPGTFKTILAGCARMGRWAEALIWLEKMSDEGN